jgi:hypothetical protein
MPKEPLAKFILSLNKFRFFLTAGGLARLEILKI